jgi:hypothetical protein
LYAEAGARRRPPLSCRTSPPQAGRSAASALLALPLVGRAIAYEYRCSSSKYFRDTRICLPMCRFAIRFCFVLGLDSRQASISEQRISICDSPALAGRVARRAGWGWSSFWDRSRTAQFVSTPTPLRFADRPSPHPDDRFAIAAGWRVRSAAEPADLPPCGGDVRQDRGGRRRAPTSHEQPSA